MSSKNDELLWHIRPIRLSDSVEYVPGSDLVFSNINEEQSRLINQAMPDLLNKINLAANKFDSLMYSENLSDEVFINVLAHTVNERVHLKLYKGQIKT